jgi:hypothetical protein
VATKIIKEKLGLYIGSITSIYLSKLDQVSGVIDSIEPPITSDFV